MAKHNGSSVPGQDKAKSNSARESENPTGRRKIIAALPCFNTESSISNVVNKTKRHVDQVIVIDDGSSDGTAEAGRASGAMVISHDTNRGYGEAIKSCFKVASSVDADILVILDGDGQHDPDEIPQILAPVLQEGADMVIGSRFLKNSATMPRYRRFGIQMLTMLFNFGSKIKVSDAQSGFRAYNMESFNNLSFYESGMGISIEILEIATMKRCNIKEIPVSCRYDSSTLNLQAFKHGFGVALSIIRIRIRHWLLGKYQK